MEERCQRLHSWPEYKSLLVDPAVVLGIKKRVTHITVRCMLPGRDVTEDIRFYRIGYVGEWDEDEDEEEADDEDNDSWNGNDAIALPSDGDGMYPNSNCNYVHADTIFRPYKSRYFL